MNMWVRVTTQYRGKWKKMDLNPYPQTQYMDGFLLPEKSTKSAIK